MRDLILTHESAIRLSFFIGVLAVIGAVGGRRSPPPGQPRPLGALAEQPRHRGPEHRPGPAAAATTAVALALVGEREGWGFLHHVGLPGCWHCQSGSSPSTSSSTCST